MGFLNSRKTAKKNKVIYQEVLQAIKDGRFKSAREIWTNESEVFGNASKRWTHSKESFRRNYGLMRLLFKQETIEGIWINNYCGAWGQAWTYKNLPKNKEIFDLTFKVMTYLPELRKGGRMEFYF